MIVDALVAEQAMANAFAEHVGRDALLVMG
jgi:hypothetical protein